MGDVPSGGIAVRVLEGCIIETRVRGYITRSLLYQSEREAEELLDATPGKPSLLIDTTGIDAFEPGLPAVALRWMSKHRERYGRMAFVAQRPLLIGVLSAIIRLLGGAPATLHASREEALEALRRRSTPPPRRNDSSATPHR